MFLWGSIAFAALGADVQPWWLWGWFASPVAEPAATEGDREAVKATIRENMGEMKACYETELATRPDLAGRVLGYWTIEDGQVSGVRVESSLQAPDFERCIGDVIAGWTFEQRLSGEASWPFVFRRAL